MSNWNTNDGYKKHFEKWTEDSKAHSMEIIYIGEKKFDEFA